MCATSSADLHFPGSYRVTRNTFLIALYQELAIEMKFAAPAIHAKPVKVRIQKVASSRALFT